jgi:hypothetical protein
VQKLLDPTLHASLEANQGHNIIEIPVLLINEFMLLMRLQWTCLCISGLTLVGSHLGREYHIDRRKFVVVNVFVVGRLDIDGRIDSFLEHNVRSNTGVDSKCGWLAVA